MTVIKEIIDLANNLTPEADNFEQDCFDALKDFQIELGLSDFNDQLAAWVLSGNLCTQLNVFNNFGQPPVTLFHNNEFVIDLYFWLYSDTSIHTHSFKGAFKVLYGESQQELYDIKTEKEFLPDVRFNSLKLLKTDILKQSQCQKITRGDSFCHRVIHNHSPTVTLCIRTVNDKEMDQWHQFENGLSIKKVVIPEAIYKSMFFFEYLIGQKPKKGRSFIKKVISTSPASLVINLFEEALSGALGLGDEALEMLQSEVLSQYRSERWFQLYLKESSDQ